ncbi:5-formyltetrahydrofolate cyclo-ligase [Longimicrobium terrae]|uniref:5-formyltetrahydrofolate cyclo-ligase n=1 Tax=Longimicrobium terrae TaxID=1639882 RepID=A0A841H6D6_9BACT|nr:5-formyltetrahydrofolate cyclo-ligase [Longimicrobium terrae]MBB6073289.1 5-formyltetrahydrofolate cyclo-ligase [Longimicrobium terrae]NNC28730.1 5-formyltetrahydrofolate cyclo-ligase [Longimicrobium terrae]
MTKQQIRAAAKAALAAIPAEERARAEADIAARVWTVPEIAAARTLLLYAALPGEVSTDVIADEARRRGILLVYPRCLDDRRLALHVVDRHDALVPGRYGIREPDVDACPIHEVSAVDAALIPGLAWDRGRQRLGRGAGYYDRLLADPEWRGFRCGLFFAAQEVAAIPADPWDRPMDAIATDSDLIR